MRPAAQLTQWLMARAHIGVPRFAGIRHKDAVRARHSVIWALRQLCPNMSYPQIAHRVGLSNHTSALDAYQKISRQREINPELVEFTDSLVTAARAEQADLLALCNPAALSPETELSLLMADVRATATRLNGLLERVDAFLNRQPPETGQ